MGYYYRMFYRLASLQLLNTFNGSWAISQRTYHVWLFTEMIFLVSDTDREDHLQNFQRLLHRLLEKGLRCRKEKCQFAQLKVEYLGHILSRSGISKGPKVDIVVRMPQPPDVSTLRFFLDSVQFYLKFLPPSFSAIAASLYRLLCD